MTRRLPVVAIYSYLVGILSPLGNLPTMTYLRSFSGGEKRQPEIQYVCFLRVPLGVRL